MATTDPRVAALADALAAFLTGAPTSGRVAGATATRKAKSPRKAATSLPAALRHETPCAYGACDGHFLAKGVGQYAHTTCEDGRAGLARMAAIGRDAFLAEAQAAD